MEWMQIFTILATTGALFIWARTEANSDRRQHQQDLKEFRDRWEAESKEFHARLLLIEERNKK